MAAAPIKTYAETIFSTPAGRPSVEGESTEGDAKDEWLVEAYERLTATDERFGRSASMGIVLVFLLGVGNFAMHKAVLESRHPLLGRVPWFVHLLGGRVSLAAEFLLLLAALLLVANVHAGWGWAYLVYSLLNGLGAWLILTRRV